MKGNMTIKEVRRAGTEIVMTTENPKQKKHVEGILEALDEAEKTSDIDMQDFLDSFFPHNQD